MLNVTFSESSMNKASISSVKFSKGCRIKSAMDTGKFKLAMYIQYKVLTRKCNN